MNKQRNKENAVHRAVAYLRFATTERTHSGVAMARHVCARRANELGAILVSVYADTASGWTDERKQLKKMLSDLVETSEIAYVIVPDHPTIARNMHLYGRIVWRIEQAGARLIVATAPLENYRDVKPNPLGVLHAVSDWATSDSPTHPTEKEGGLSDSSVEEAQDD